MFICSFKASKIKLFGGIVLMLVAIIGAVSLFSGNKSEVLVAGAQKSLRLDGIKSEEELCSFINELGIEVKTPAYNRAQVDIPRVFDSVYKRYNDIQKQQGLDLSKYRGKALERYTFLVTNYPNDGSGEGKVYLTLFLSDDKVVAGDISSRDYGGFVRTFIDFASPDAAQG